MKKQIIAITLAAVMAAGMTGCGSSNGITRASTWKPVILT